MIEMTTNSTDHRSEIAPYAAPGSTCEATAKYAKVNRPVDAMPTDSTRAPRAYPSVDGADAAEPPSAAAGAVAVSATQPDEQHGPRERRARLDDLAVAAEQRDERALGPVVQVPGRVAEVAQVRAARHVERAPQRL